MKFFLLLGWSIFHVIWYFCIKVLSFRTKTNNNDHRNNKNGKIVIWNNLFVYLATWKCLFFKMCNWNTSYSYHIGISKRFIIRTESNRGLWKHTFFCDKASRCHLHGADRRCLSNMATCSRGKFCIQIGVEVGAGKACLRWRVLIQLPRKRCRPWQYKSAARKLWRILIEIT